MPVTPVKLAGWRMEPPVSVPVAPRHQARRHGRGRAARRAARHTRGVPGVQHRAEGRVFVGRAHRELVAVQLAQAHGAGRRRGAAPRWHRTGCGSRPASSSRRWSAARAVTKMSLCATGTPSSGAGFARGAAGIGGLGLRQGAGVIDGQERAQRAVRGNSCQQVLREFGAGDLFVGQRAAQFGHAQIVQIACSFDHLRHQEQPVLDRRRAALVGRCAGRFRSPRRRAAAAKPPARPTRACTAARRRWCPPRSSVRRCGRSRPAA